MLSKQINKSSFLFLVHDVKAKSSLVFLFLSLNENTRPLILLFVSFISLFFSSFNLFWGFFFSPPHTHQTNKRILFRPARSAFSIQFTLFLDETFPSTSYHKIIIVIPLISSVLGCCFHFTQFPHDCFSLVKSGNFSRLHSSTARDKLSFLFCYIRFDKLSVLLFCRAFSSSSMRWNAKSFVIICANLLEIKRNLQMTQHWKLNRGKCIYNESQKSRKCISMERNFQWNSLNQQSRHLQHYPAQDSTFQWKLTNILLILVSIHSAFLYLH